MYLLRQGTVPNRDRWLQDRKILPLLSILNLNPVTMQDIIKPGDTADALLRFINAPGAKVFGKLGVRSGMMGDRSSNRKSVLIRYLVRASQEKELYDTLADWPNRPPRTAEPIQPALPRSMVIGLDDGQECFIWTASQGQELLELSLPASARAFHNAGKRVREGTFTIQGILNNRKYEDG